MKTLEKTVMGMVLQTNETELFCIRTSLYNIWTDYYDIGQYYCTVRMPKECWQVFMAVKPCNVAYKRKGYMWLQIPINEVHMINRGCSIYGKHIEQYFPKSKYLFIENNEVV